MTSFGYRLNPRYAIKECLSSRALYTRECFCSKGSVEDKVLVPRPPKNLARCAKCGHPVNGPYCQGCSLLREKLEEDLVTYLKYFQDTSESSDNNTNIVNAPREPFVVKQDHSVKSSQNPPHIDECCCECGNVLDGIFCQQCICKSCGKGAHTGYNYPPKVSIISNPEPCNQTMNNELPQTLLSFGSVPCVSKPNFVDGSSNIFNPPPQPPIYSCEFCGSNAQYGHYCTPQAPFNNPEPGYSQDLNFPVTHEPYQCPPKNHDYYHEQNFCYDSNSFGIDHCQTPQYTVNHPVFNVHNDILHSQNKLTITQNKIMEQMIQLTSICEMACQIVQKKLEEKQIEEEQAAKAQNRKLPVCYDDDDDEEESSSLKDNIISELPLCSAITPNEPIDSLSMGDKHLDTISTTKSDEVIKYSVEDLVPIPSESEGENGCDVPSCFTTFSNILFDADYDFESVDDQSLHNEDVSEKIFSNLLFEEEIISIKKNQHHFNAESDLVESMLNRDSSIISSSSKIDSLLNELLYDNSSPRPPEEFVFENSNAKIESFSPSPIPNEDSDSFMEEIDLFLTPDDPMPPSIKDDEDSEGDTLSLERLLHDDLIPLSDTLDFSYEVRVLIPFFTYPVTSPVLLSFGSEDKIFDPGITIN
nr:hypothetical protein [Tanacetum cinerariifolium]